jgi:hypothetical protein
VAARKRARRIAGVLLICAAVILAGAALALAGRGGEARVRGLITSVQARDIGHAEAITIRTEDGRELRLQVDPQVEMTPGHMREHMTFGEPVTVYYRRSGTSLIAVRVTD